MIKEYNYYIGTNRFSQITEELDSAIREYAQAVEKSDSQVSDFREKARKLCAKHLITSGLRSKNNSFINIDAEFFEGEELIENSLNCFIKDILKAHSYQKILWEYMGTTGLMTEISMATMENDGFSYENYLPFKLKEREHKKNFHKLNRNFNRLNEDSGFDWGHGYDPNVSIEKKGWFSNYDENGVWTRFITEKTEPFSERLDNTEDIYRIRLIKTDKGCMLCDTEMILLNPVLLWYFTQEDEIYGIEQSDNSKIIKEIQIQMERIGAKKITEIAWGNNLFSSAEKLSEKSKQEICSKYKNILNKFADEKLILVDSVQANKTAYLNTVIEKNIIIQKEAESLKKRIDVVIKSNPNCTPEDLIRYIQSDKVEIPVDITEEKDAEIIGLNEDEYQTFILFAAELQGKKRKEFSDICTILSTFWDEYKSCARTKEECMKLLFDYIKTQKENNFNYELTLKQVLELPVMYIQIEKEHTSYEKEIESIIKETLPRENQEAALEYISSLPEQAVENKEKVYKTLCAVVNNYLAVRMSTGMSIEEIFDYAVKSSGGKLPKSSFIPPVVGYINRNIQGQPLKDSTGEKRVSFEGKVSSFYNTLKARKLPNKEVPISILEKNYKKVLSKNHKPVVTVGFNNSTHEIDINENKSIWFDIGEYESLNPVILAILRVINIQDKESKSKILTIVHNTEEPEEFVLRLSKEFSIKYNLADETAREVYALEKLNVTKEILDEYIQDIEEKAAKTVQKPEYVSSKKIEITPIFTQVDFKNLKSDEFAARSENSSAAEIQDKIVLPVGYCLMERKKNYRGILEKINRITSRQFDIESKLYLNTKIDKSSKTSGFIIEKANSIEESYLNIKDKETIKVIYKKLTESEQRELFYVAGEDWNNITPLLIKEFIWRRKNKQSIKNILKEINVYENLWKLPQSELEKYFISNTVNESLKDVSFEKTSLNFNAKNEILISVKKLTGKEKKYLQTNYGLQMEEISPVIQEYIKSGDWKTVRNITLLKEIIANTSGKDDKKIVKLFIEKLNASDKNELLYAAEENLNNITPFLLKEFLWRKSNEKSIKKLYKELNTYKVLKTIPEGELKKLINSTGTTVHQGPNITVMHLTKEDKVHYRQVYGIDIDNMSPIVKAYIRSGIWKNNSSIEINLPVARKKPTVNFSKQTTMIPCSIIRSGVIKSGVTGTACLDAETSSEELLNKPLKDSLIRIAEYGHTKNQHIQEMAKLDRINANYEHDKVVLAKSDPLFAMNQFWDVGHAEGSSEISERGIGIAANKLQKAMLEKLEGKQI